MAKYNAAKIEECEAWVAAHGLIDYGGAKLKEFVVRSVPPTASSRLARFLQTPAPRPSPE